MSFFATIQEESRRRQLRFLVIGGLAVNHFGFSRDTGDLDFFVSQGDRAEWMKILDVENLMRINRLDIKSENIRELFVKYGTADLYEKISSSLASE